MHIRIAARPSKLAMIQAGIVTDALRKIHPEIECEIIGIKTSGDKDTDKTLWNISETGFFTGKIEQALLADTADAAVHSFKDLPSDSSPLLTVAAVLDRKFPADVLVAKNSIKSIADLPKAAKIGTSSLRRKVQLKRLREDLHIVPIRGNVPTRLNKVDQGQFDAVILARAGLERLDLSNRISIAFDPEQFIPSPAQGALVVQIRKNNTDLAKIIACLNDRSAQITTYAERWVLKRINAGCHAPAGAFAKITKDGIIITAFASLTDGENFIKKTIIGPAEKAMDLAEELAQNLLDAGIEGIINA